MGPMELAVIAVMALIGFIVIKAMRSSRRDK